MNQFKFKIIGAAFVLFLFTACVDDLNTEPKVELTLSFVVISEESGPSGPERAKVP